MVIGEADFIHPEKQTISELWMLPFQKGIRKNKG